MIYTLGILENFDSLLALLLLFALLLLLWERIRHEAHFDLGVHSFTWFVLKIIGHQDSLLQCKHVYRAIILSQAVLNGLYLL